MILAGIEWLFLVQLVDKFNFVMIIVLVSQRHGTGSGIRDQGYNFPWGRNSINLFKLEN